jgi:hypothetical protein
MVRTKSSSLPDATVVLIANEHLEERTMPA